MNSTAAAIRNPDCARRKITAAGALPVLLSWLCTLCLVALLLISWRSYRRRQKYERLGTAGNQMGGIV